MKKRYLHHFALAAVLLFGSGCAKIPAEAPKLSSELGHRIAAIEASHIALLRRYMNDKRQRVDEFFNREWTPKFAQNYFQQPNIAKIWDQVVASGNKSDRLKLLTLVGPKLQVKLNQERVKLIQPLDEIEKEIERRLRDEYRQARSINNSITSFLVSASAVVENRNRLFELSGIENEEISRVIADADKAVVELVESRNDINRRFDNFATAITDAKNQFLQK